MPPQPKDVLGREGERLAADALERAGFEILARNWRPARTGPGGGRGGRGELDVVARDGRDVVAVEVKTRSGPGFGHPFDAITADKLDRIHRLLRQWCRESGVRAPMRVDAVSVIIPTVGAVTVEHLRGVWR